MDAIPLEILFIATLLILYIAIELGYRIGNTHPENLKKHKEKITSANSSALLTMLTFILVFTFGIVYSRYDSKKALLREEANMIRTAWMRSDFLPEQERTETVRLFKQYLDLHIEAAQSDDLVKMPVFIKESAMIQNQIWNIAVVNAMKDMNSHVAALYIESLNEMINQQALRVAVGVQARIPTAIWVILYLLIIAGMFSIGYMTSISSSSKKSWLTPIMVFSFSLIITLIASLDRPDSNIIKVSQQPLVDLRAWMEEVK